MISLNLVKFLVTLSAVVLLPKRVAPSNTPAAKLNPMNNGSLTMAILFLIGLSGLFNCTIRRKLSTN